LDVSSTVSSSPRQVCSQIAAEDPHLARGTIIESKFEVGHRFHCTMRIDGGQFDPGAAIRPVASEWHPQMPERLDEVELAD
jgi:hypothetical protein